MMMMMMMMIANRGNITFYQTRPHKSARFARAPIKTSPLTKRAIERRTLVRRLELFKARASSSGQKKTEVVCHATFVTRLKERKKENNI